MSYISRGLEAVVRSAAREFPAVVVTGPRQSGKTTMLKHLFAETHTYVSLEPPDTREAAVSDPRGFLALYRPPVIFDEVQYAPGLLSYIKEAIDQDRAAVGRFILTGSQNLAMQEKVTETLAGRAAMLRLLPLSFSEKAGNPVVRFPWEEGGKVPTGAAADTEGLWRSIIRGGYPELNTGVERNVSLWHSSYVQTYLERDVRNLRHVGDLTTFQNFLRILAARSGQLLSLSDISRDLGISVNTVKQWLSILEATYQVIVLRPYFENAGKRLVKSPKVYFTDTGTLCHLVGLKDAYHAAAGPMGGALFETVVLTEIFKGILNRGEEPRLYFWRTSNGAEVDIVVESGGRLVPIEVKLSQTPGASMANHIRAFRKDYPEKALPGYIVHPGDVTLPLGEGNVALPFRALTTTV